MKNILLLIMLCTFVFVACSDDDDKDDDKPIDRGRLINKITESYKNDSRPNEYTFEYDAQGRVTKRDAGGHVHTYTYTQNSIIFKDYYENEFSVQIEYKLNDKGLITLASETTSSDLAHPNVTNYTYNENNQLINVGDETLTWKDGNIVSIGTDSYTDYTYNQTEYNGYLLDLLLPGGSDNINLILMDYGYMGQRCKNLIATDSDGCYEYTFDKEGYITKIVQGNWTYTITYKE